MEQNIEGNIVLAHGGAPTAVINASLYGSIRALKSLGFRGKILAARYGSKGLYHGDFIDLTNIGDEALENLKNTPGTAIGSSRFPLYEKEYAHIVDLLKESSLCAFHWRKRLHGYLRPSHRRSEEERRYALLRRRS